MAGSFLKCGYLKIKRPPTSGKVRIKAWQSKYFVLRDIPPIFEYFKDEFSFHNARHTKEKNKINLESVIHIGTTDASKTQRNAFMIVDAKKGAIMLAADSGEETKEWVDALNRVSGKNGSPGPNGGEFMHNESELSPVKLQPNSRTSSISSPTLEDLGSTLPFTDMQGFPVTTRLTPSSEKLGIRDDYTMYIKDEYVAIHVIETSRLVVQWPIIGLRGWKSEPADVAGRKGTQLLTLEAGRKSATGEGLFQFFSDFGNHIAHIIRVRSNVLAVEKFDSTKSQERRNSAEDPCPDVNEKTPKRTFVKSATEPRPVGSFMATHKLSFSKRSESVSSFFDKDIQRKISSPGSLRKEVLSKDIKQCFSENSTSLQQSADNTYLDLISDKDAIPVHIDDAGQRKSLDSLSLNSDEGIIMQRNTINTANEIDNSAESYIDDREISTYKKKQLKNRKSLEDKSDIVVYSDPKKLKSLDSQAQNTQQSSSHALCQNFLDQLSNPIDHQANIFQEKAKTFPFDRKLIGARNEEMESSDLAPKSKETPVDGVLAPKSEQASVDAVLADKSKQECVDGVSNPNSKILSKDRVFAEKFSPESPLSNGKDACQSNNNDNNNTSINQSECSATTSVHEEPTLNNIDQSELTEEPITMRKPLSSSNSEKRVVPHGKKEAKDLLEKLMSTLESPQTKAQEGIFPLLTSRDDKLEKTKSDTTSNYDVRCYTPPKKTIEKSKSHIGFDIKQQTEKPPPLPMRPEMTSHARTKPSASLGDISKDLPRPLDFHKDIHRQLSPWASNNPALGAPCGPESLVHARLLHRSTSGSSFGAFKEAHQLSYHELEKTSTPGFDGSRSRLARGSVDFPAFNQENDRVGDEDFDKRRRGSKATMFLSRVLHTFNPVDSKRRGSCDIVSDVGSRESDLGRNRRSSSLIGGGIVNEGWSPEQSLDFPSPEGSPQNFRKSLAANRRQSHDLNMDRNRKIFVGSPTFDPARSREEIRQRERAKERERERSELPNEPPPQLPPRKKSDPPPLPPRIRKLSSDSSSGPSSHKYKLQQHEASSNTVCDETTPPPIPPRRLDDRRGSQPAPVIHLTMSSPDEKPQNSSFGPFPGVEAADTIAGASTQPHNNTSTEASENGAMPHPVPQLPKATHGEMTSHHIQLNILEKTTESRDQATDKPINTEHSFVSIEMKERVNTDPKLWTLEERLEIREIERDSVGVSPQSSNTSPKGSGHAALNPQSSSGSPGRCSPGHTPPVGLSLSPRSGGIALVDSPTAPISV